MIEALGALVFWRKDRRKEVQPVTFERRRTNSKKVQQQLLESVEKLSEAVKRAQGKNES